MNGKTAALVLCAICVAVAALLLAGFIQPIVAGSAFAAALAVLGLTSSGFREGAAAK